MSKLPENIVVCAKRTVEFAVFEGRMLAREFIDTQIKPKTKGHILAIFGHMADETELKMGAMFCQERGEIHAFKSKENKLRIRLPCFRLGDRWIVTHGFFKVGGESEWAEEEFTLANKIRNAVLEIERKTQHHRASSL